MTPPRHPLTPPFERNVRAFGEQLPDAAAGGVEPLQRMAIASPPTTARTKNSARGT